MIRYLSILSLVLVSACSKVHTIKAFQVTEAAVESTVSTTSTGTVDAEQQAVLGFAVAGRVARILVKPGDLVIKGQILGELDNNDLTAIYEDAQRELARAELLAKEGLISKSSLDDARRSTEVARSNRFRSQVYAPFAGLVTEVNLEVGELSQGSTVGIGTNLKVPFRIVDQRPRLIRGQIDENDISKIKVGTPARVKIQAVRSTSFAAEVSRVVPFVSSAKEQDRTSEIELKILEKSSDKLPVGASADIELIYQAKEKTIAVPTRSLLGIGKGRFVYRIIEDRLVKTPVETGVGNYDRMEITQGLKLGETVAFPSPDFEMTEGMKVKLEMQQWP